MVLSTLLAAAIAVPPPAGYNPRPVLDAIRAVESGGRTNLVGDGGKAIGPYQIHYEYWRDAVAYNPSIGGTYRDCTNTRYAESVVLAYLSRYTPNWNAQTLARVHNGGPRGYRNRATVGYWAKVDSRL
jgi:hypothetical protein